MEIKEYKDYNIANISEDELSTINDLEKSISSKSNKDIILIAYQHQDGAES